MNKITETMKNQIGLICIAMAILIALSVPQPAPLAIIELASKNLNKKKIAQNL